MPRRGTSADSIVAAGLGLILIGAATGLLAQRSRAASLCLGSQAYSCNTDPIFLHLPYIHENGFSTSGSSCQHGGDFTHQILISASNTDPNTNQGVITDGFLYLWVYSTATGSQYGFNGAQTDFFGDLHITAFDFIAPGGGNWVPPDRLVWGVGCPNTGWQLAGRFTVEQPIAVESGSWGRMKALYR